MQWAVNYQALSTNIYIDIDKNNNIQYTRIDTYSMENSTV
jgi:hypothetical protein